MNFGIITVSDKGAAGLREDESSKVIFEMLAPYRPEFIYRIIPDERELISSTLTEMSDKLNCRFIATTGGTGFSPRDVTPEATLDVIDRQAPGLAEAMRASGLAITPHAMLSRAVAGIRGKTLIVNLPGSPKAVRENLAVLLPALEHALSVLGGNSGDCA